VALARVSVIIPTRNRCDELRIAASSVLSQDLRELELVVVDDASTDTTPDLLEQLTKDPRVRTTRNERALGECESRNLGLRLAEGDFVAFCDDDDSWLPGAATALLEYLTENAHVGAVSSWYKVLHADTGRTVDFRGPRNFDARQLLWQNFTIVFGMFRRSAFSAPLHFDPALVTGGDWDFWLRSALERPVKTLPRFLYTYRRHGGSQVTAAVVRQAEGRTALLTKHASRMSTACRLYHETVLVGYRDGRSGMRRHLAGSMRTRARDATYVGAVLAGSSAASHLGMRLGDPGLQARLMAKMVRWDPSFRSET